MLSYIVDVASVLALWYIIYLCSSIAVCSLVLIVNFNIVHFSFSLL